MQDEPDGVGAQISGRKRHLLVDVTRLVLRATVHAAGLQDRAGVSMVLEGVEEEFLDLEHVWADQGCTGTGKAWIEEHLSWTVEIVQHPPHPRGEWRIVPEPDDPTRGHFEWFRLPPAKKGFRGILPRRWIAERKFSSLLQSRRLSKEYERRCETSEAMIYTVMSRIMFRRLARA